MYRLYGLLMIVCMVFCALALSAALLIGRQSDADVLVYTLRGDLWLLEYPSLQNLQITYTTQREIRSPALSIDGRLAYMEYVERVMIDDYSSYYTCNIWVDDQLINTQLLTDCSSLDWSLDGRLAFSAAYRDQRQEIFIWDGVSLHNWSDTPEYNEHSPSWSPEGYLAFVSDREGNLEVYVETSQGNINISSSSYEDYHPRWSQDGRLAFVMGTGAMRQTDIAIWDGLQTSRITFDSNHNTFSEWSFDGRLAFVSNPFTKNDVYIWDGENMILLIQLPEIVATVDFAWSPSNLLVISYLTQGGYEMISWDGASIEPLISEYSYFGFIDFAWMPRNR